MWWDVYQVDMAMWSGVSWKQLRELTWAPCDKSNFIAPTLPVNQDVIDPHQNDSLFTTQSHTHMCSQVKWSLPKMIRPIHHSPSLQQPPSCREFVAPHSIVQGCSPTQVLTGEIMPKKKYVQKWLERAEWCHSLVHPC